MIDVQGIGTIYKSTLVAQLNRYPNVFADRLKRVKTSQSRQNGASSGMRRIWLGFNFPSLLNLGAYADGTKMPPLVLLPGVGPLKHSEISIWCSCVHMWGRKE